MSDPTARDAVNSAIARYVTDDEDATPTDLADLWGWTDRAAFDFGRCVLDVLGIDPDAPLSLLTYHATMAERERCVKLTRRAAMRLPWATAVKFHMLRDRIESGEEP